MELPYFYIIGWLAAISLRLTTGMELLVQATCMLLVTVLTGVSEKLWLGPLNENAPLVGLSSSSAGRAALLHPCVWGLGMPCPCLHEYTLSLVTCPRHLQLQML